MAGLGVGGKHFEHKPTAHNLFEKDKPSPESRPCIVCLDRGRYYHNWVIDVAAHEIRKRAA